MDLASDAIRKGNWTFAEWFEWAASYVQAMDKDLTPSRCWVDWKRGALLWEAGIICESDDMQKLFALAEWYITRDWADRLAEKYVICHAAVLEHQGGALLLAGGPGAGKSTLALGLVRRGFRYLGDEFAVICPQTLSALPFPSALHIEGASAAMVAPGDPHFEAIFHSGDEAHGIKNAVCCLPQREIVPAAGERFPLRWLVFLKGESARNHRAPVPGAEAVVGLCEASWGISRTRFSALAAVARRARSWELGRAGLDEMIDSIISLTGRRG